MSFKDFTKNTIIDYLKQRDEEIAQLKEEISTFREIAQLYVVTREIPACKDCMWPLCAYKAKISSLNLHNTQINVPEDYDYETCDWCTKSLCYDCAYEIENDFVYCRDCLERIVTTEHINPVNRKIIFKDKRNPELLKSLICKSKSGSSLNENIK